jgi:peptide/nickel transport system substrate-binding protein
MSHSSLRSKKFARVIVGVVLATGVLASATTASASQKITGKKSDTLGIVAPVEPASMNPVKQANSFGNFWEQVQEPIVKLSSDFKITKNGLVTDWKQTVPGTWRLTLRSGVKFTNGEPWDAAALAFTMTTYRDTVGAPMRAYLTKLTTTKVVSPTVLEAVFSAADSSIPAVLSSVRALPPVYYAQVGHDAFGLNPVGTGPYKFKNWTKGVELRLERNDKYWGTKARIKNIAFSFSADSDTRASLLATGAVDFAIQVPVQRIDKLNNAKTSVVQREDRVQIALFFMGQKTELKELELRKAATLAVNVKLITDKVLLGKGGKPNCALLLPLLGKPVFPGCKQQDLAAAKAITAKYNNPTITFNYGPARAPSDEAVAQAVAGQLRAAGFTVNMAPAEYNAVTTNLVLGKSEGIVMFAISPVFPQPNVYAQGFLTPTSITKNCLAPGMADLAAKALSAATPAEADLAYKDMEKVAINEQYCMLPLYNEIKNWGLSKSLGGFIAPPAVVIDWSKLFWK